MNKKINPSRELDALIAEKVMGLAVFNGMIFRYIQDYKEGDVATAESCPIPKYSTDIAAAWEVVDKLGGDFVLHRKTAWECVFFLGRDKYFQDRSETAPHAICLAALKTVGSR
jgi:hypothetical protein